MFLSLISGSLLNGEKSFSFVTSVNLSCCSKDGILKEVIVTVPKVQRGEKKGSLGY